MDKTEKLPFIHSALSDAEDVVSNLQYIDSMLRDPKYSTQNKNDDEILYKLRNAVKKCDDISNMLEKNFDGMA